MIKLDWTIFLQFANFFILLLLLNAILYRPLRGILARRRETLEGAHQRARDLELQINEKMAQYQAQLQDAKARGTQERMKLRQQAVEEENRTLAQARETAALQVQELRAKVSADAVAARDVLRAETNRLASEIAGKVLGRSI